MNALHAPDPQKAVFLAGIDTILRETPETDLLVVFQVALLVMLLMLLMETTFAVIKAV